MKLQPFGNPRDVRNGPKYHTGKLCIEGCGRPAGTAWSKHWCFKCNVERMKRIGVFLAKAVKRGEGHKL